MSSFDNDGEHGDIRRIDSGDARGLSQRLGTVLFQFFTTFKTYCTAAIIVEPMWNIDHFIFFCAPCCIFLLFYIRRIMSHNI